MEFAREYVEMVMTGWRQWPHPAMCRVDHRIGGADCGVERYLICDQYESRLLPVLVAHKMREECKLVLFGLP